MFTHFMYSIPEGGRFIPSDFPALEASLQQVVSQLAAEPGVKAEMVLSFVKDHCINSVLVANHPALAALISTKALPLQPMEALFEAGRCNPLFNKQLEEHIRSRFAQQGKP